VFRIRICDTDPYPDALILIPSSVSKYFYFFISQAAERERIKAAKEKASAAKAAAERAAAAAEKPAVAAAERAAAEKASAEKAAAGPGQSPGKAVEKDARLAYVKVS
jgi:hypothetical protein